MSKLNGSEQISAATLTRALINTATAGSALITKLLLGSGSLGSLASTGADSGTGDVTLTVPAAAGSDVQALSSATKAITPAALASAMAFYNETQAAGTYAPNIALGFNRAVTLTGNVTFGQFTNAFDGLPFVIEVIQDATGSRTISWNTTYWKFPGGNLPVASTAANAVDRLAGIFRSRSGTIVAECTGYEQAIQ